MLTALIAANNLFARGRLKHQYPHSWRSKKPIIFRNTPQWFVYMDKDLGKGADDTLRTRALSAIDATKFVPAAGQNRLRSMIADRPDWVLSRQRAWGVPITVFVNKDTGEILKNEKVNHRIVESFMDEGADACTPGIVRFISTEQASGFFMLGETTKTSAAGKDVGKTRSPFTQPFFPLAHGLQAKRFSELVATMPTVTLWIPARMISQ